jgi:hypothetical protein
MEVKLALHADAIKNCDDKVNNLLLALEPEPERSLRQASRSSFSPDTFISGHFREQDIIGELKMSWVDYSGKEVARYFRYGERFIGLHGENYKKLVQLAEQMRRPKQLYSSVSITLLVELIFDWMRAKYTDQAVPTMTEYVLRECENRVQDLEIWLPIAATHVQSELRIGKIILKTITRETIDRWRDQCLTDTPEDEVKLMLLFDRERKILQGLAAATMKVVAEPKRAFELALEETEKAIGLLRFFGPENFRPEMSSYCTVLGKEQRETVTHLIIQDQRLIYLSQGTVDRGWRPLILDDTLLSKMKGSGLDILSDLLVKEDRSEFEERILNALLLYSRSPLEKNIPAKLIYIFAALESVLLKDEKESIQQNISERIAFVIGTTTAERRSIISNIKSVYTFRSRFFHHGHGIDEVETISIFMANTWRFFTRLIQCVNHFSTTADFLNSVEERKLA